MAKNRLRELREDHDLLQKDLAKVLNCTQVAYSRYELGKREIPTDALVVIADYYHTSVDYILCMTDKSEPYRRSEE